MIKKLKPVLFLALAALSSLLVSCESDADTLGSQLFAGNSISGTEAKYDVNAYILNHSDTLRADNTKLVYATLGSFTEGQFGMQKSSYVTQARLSSYAPDFGTNPVLDSAVLVLKPLYATDSATVSTDSNYTYPDGSVASKKVVTSYPVLKYGKASHNFNINVEEVTDFLGSYQDASFSNKSVATGALLGTKNFTGKISSVVVTKNSDGSTLLTRDANLRIALDNSYFQDKIINKTGAADLADASAFIRYFKGIKISVDNNDAYLMRFTPNDAAIILYYKHDVTSSGTTTRPQVTYSLTLGKGNVHFNNIQYDRSNSAYATTLASTPDGTTSTKLYLQGMGGPGIGVKIPESVYNDLKTQYKNNKIGIVSAKIRFYSDEISWNNNYAKPTDLIANVQDNYAFLPEFTSYATDTNYKPVRTYNLSSNPAYYDVTVTKVLKDWIEKDVPYSSIKDIDIDAGSFVTSTNTAGASVLTNYWANSRSYTMNRMVMVGSDPNRENRIRLLVAFGQK